MIEGYLAIVQFVPEGALDSWRATYDTLVVLYDLDSKLEFWVYGHHHTLRGNNVEGTIAIALSLTNNGNGQ